MGESNGILLSPSVDALFDKYLISFEDSGEIILNPNISYDDTLKLGIHHKMKLETVFNGMLKYLKEHRNKTFKQAL